MSRDLTDEKYYISNNSLVPIKWTAPEAIRFRKYSSASDVWSYGCVLYEIWSLGCDPYENLSNSEVCIIDIHLCNYMHNICHYCLQVFVKLESGYEHPTPPGCPEVICELMTQCW